MDIRDCSSEALFTCEKKLWQSLGQQFKSLFFLFNSGEKSRTVASQEVLEVTLFAHASAYIKQEFTSFPTSARVRNEQRRNILKFISVAYLKELDIKV